VLSFADETDPTIAAFLREFHAPTLSMTTPTTRQAVGRAQVNYLVKQGHSQIIFAAPDRADVQWLAQARLQGVRQGCAECSLAPPVVQVVPGTRPGARQAITTLLSTQSPPFGICCYNDEVAFAVLAALTDAGISIPQPVSVIGCDDIPLAQFSIPALTTIRFEQRPSLDFLIENILAAIRGIPIQEAPPQHLSVIVRESG
jgi:DNA-binding LacI/PurR family transcriptional regulator